jgi:nicotinamidase-related amidase
VPVDLVELVEPGHTAVVTMELQRAVVGDLATMPQLADAVATVGLIPVAARLVTSARRAGVPVVHCTAEFRPDRKGSARNSPMLAAVLRDPEHMVIGSPGVALVPELGPEAGDVVISRVHGVSPFAGTALDATLRNMGVTTVVTAGVSVNVGILGLVIEAVNLGYRVVVVADAVVGVPVAYGVEVMRHTMSLLATVAKSAEVVAAWAGSTG